MASFTPYTYIQCPCHDSTVQGRSADDALPAASHELDDDDDDDHAFDPRAYRSNFSLHPLEYLLYCDVCHQIRCPRCVSEEVVTIYCPSCLFEVGSSSLKTEGNRYVPSSGRGFCVWLPEYLWPGITSSTFTAETLTYIRDQNIVWLTSLLP